MPTLRTVAATASGLYIDTRTRKTYRHDELLTELPDVVLEREIVLQRRAPGIYVLQVDGPETIEFDVLSRRRARRGGNGGNSSRAADDDHRSQSVILIEDDLDLRALLSAVLTEEGYTVAGFDFGEQAIAAAQELQPALIIVDMVLPDMTGIEFMDRLLATDVPPPPAIVMSGSTPLLEMASASCLFAAMLSKPFGLLDLIEAVDGVLQHAANGHDLLGRETRSG